MGSVIVLRLYCGLILSSLNKSKPAHAVEAAVDCFRGGTFVLHVFWLHVAGKPSSMGIIYDGGGEERHD